MSSRKSSPIDNHTEKEPRLDALKKESEKKKATSEGAIRAKYKRARQEEERKREADRMASADKLKKNQISKAKTDWEWIQQRALERGKQKNKPKKRVTFADEIDLIDEETSSDDETQVTIKKKDKCLIM